jgi:hypothetical protein
MARGIVMTNRDIIPAKPKTILCIWAVEFFTIDPQFYCKDR